MLMNYRFDHYDLKIRFKESIWRLSNQNHSVHTVCVQINALIFSLKNIAATSSLCHKTKSKIRDLQIKIRVI